MSPRDEEMLATARRLHRERERLYAAVVAWVQATRVTNPDLSSMNAPLWPTLEECEEQLRYALRELLAG